MKYLKGYKLFENHEDINAICEEYYITNYTINPDNSIDVDGGVDLSNKGLTKLPLKFRNITGYFWCNKNQLTSLEGAPSSIGFGFDCSDNKITSLEYAPRSVEGYFSCFNNKITNLRGFPEHVGGDVYIENNPVNSVINTWIGIKERRWELLEYFEEMNAIQGDTVVVPRLKAFSEEMNVKMPNIEEIEKYYKIIE